MNKAFKIGAWVVGIFLLIYILAIILITTLVNPNDYKKLITDAASHYTNRPIVIEGDLSLNFFPWLGLKANNIIIGNPKNFITPKSSLYFAKIGEADFNLSILSLLSGKIFIKNITVKNSIINLITNSSGAKNWQNLAVPVVPPVKIKPLLNQPTKIKAIKLTHKIKSINSYLNLLPKINIVNMKVNWLNQKNNQKIQIKNLNAVLNPEPDRIILLSLNFNLLQDQPVLGFSFNLNSKAKINNTNELINLQKFQLKVIVNKFETPLSNPLTITLNTNTIINLKKQILNPSKINLEVNNLHLTGNISGKEIIDAPKLQGSIKTNKFNLRQLLNDFAPGFQIQSKSALTSVATRFDFDSSPNIIKLSNVNIALDNSIIHGQITYKKLKKPTINFDLQSNSINLDDYQLIQNSTVVRKIKKSTTAQISQNKRKTESSKTITTVSPTLAPLKAINNYNWNGIIKINSLMSHGLNFRNVLLSTRNQQGFCTITPFRASLANGNIVATISINATQVITKYSMNLKANNLPAASVINAFYKTNSLQGILDLQTQVNSKGNNQIELIRNLNGNGRIDISQGSIKGLDIAHYIRLGILFLKRNQTIQLQPSDETRFTNLNATYTISNGVLYNQDMQLRSQNVQAAGQGVINLITNQIKYNIVANYGQNSLQVPITISGSLQKPKVSLNVGQLSKQLLKKNIQQQINKRLHDFLGKDFKFKFP